MKPIDLTKQTFGRLTVISKAPQRDRRIRWICKCSCGREKEILADSLRAGRSESCGCLHKELLAKITKTHGMSESPEFKIWAKMIQRCTNPKTREYHNYGGRGITVCSEWMTSFPAFFSHIGTRPSGTSIERVNNSKGYEPGNVKWATRSEQNNNTRRTRRLTHDGKTMSMRQWATKLGVNYGTLKRRLNRGMPIETAFSKRDLRSDLVSPKSPVNGRFLPRGSSGKVITISLVENRASFE